MYSYDKFNVIHLNCTGELRREYPVPFPDAVKILGLLPQYEYRSLNQKYELEPNSRKPANQNEDAYKCMYVSASRTCPADEEKAFSELLVTFYST